MKPLATRALRPLVTVAILISIGLFFWQLEHGPPAAGVPPRRAAGGFAGAEQPAGTSTGGTPTGGVIVSEPVIPSISLPVRELPLYQPEYHLDREINPRLSLNAGLVDLEGVGGILGGVDPLLELQESAPQGWARAFGTPILNFEGQGFTGVHPPDPEGDVGPHHYLQMINGSGGAVFVIYDKTGAVMAGPTSLDSLGTLACASGLGDPIVLYDRLADRWLLSEFSEESDRRLCVYISRTADPLGEWYHYVFEAPEFPDYPKYGVWPDAYYVSTNEWSPAVYALDRNQMLSGKPATFQRFAPPSLAGFGFQAFTPSDLDGSTPPPAGSPNYLIRHRDDEVHNSGYNNPGVDYLEIWEFSVDFATPANSSLSGPQTVPIAEIDSDLCGLTSFECIPMPGTGTTLDPLREVVMWRLQYRNFGSHETLVGNLTTDVDNTDHAGIRWFELRKSGGGAWALFQQGTYAPDEHGRWMGSIAMDGSGNIALGYSVSSSTVYPSVRYAGRLSGDPLGTLPQGEIEIVDGSGSNSSFRWGDYSSMHVDPADDCTFWYTNMYSPGSNWSTRIATFRFDACGSPDFTLAADPISQAACVSEEAVYDVALGQLAGWTEAVTLTVSGEPAGATTGWSSNPVHPPGASRLTIGNLDGAAAGSYAIEIGGVATTSTHTITVALDIHATVPSTPSLTSPAGGATSVSTSPLFEWTAVAGADVYLLEVATDPTLGGVVYSATVPGVSHAAAATLAPGADHYWRVTAQNPCGWGGASTVSAFATTNLICSEPGMSIPDGDPAGAHDILTVSATGAITDLDVYLEATHSYVGDLIVELQHVESGASATLIDRPGYPATTYGCDGEDIEATLDDEAADPVEEQCAESPAIGGTVIPHTPLSAFDGENLAGNWKLTVIDSETLDTGTLVKWCLVPDLDPLFHGVSLEPATAALVGPAGEMVTYTLRVTNTGNVSDVLALDHAGNAWPTSVSPASVPLAAGAGADVTVQVSIPAGAAAGATDVVTVTLTSTSYAGASDSSTLTTRRTGSTIHLPLVARS